jgi:hypothetical protein
MLFIPTDKFGELTYRFEDDEDIDPSAENAFDRSGLADSSRMFDAAVVFFVCVCAAGH